jgi:hypothetical protein
MANAGKPKATDKAAASISGGSISGGGTGMGKLAAAVKAAASISGSISGGGAGKPAAVAARTSISASTDTIGALVAAAAIVELPAVGLPAVSPEDSSVAAAAAEGSKASPTLIMSDYERKRYDRIKSNEAHLRDLGLADAAQKLKESGKNKRKATSVAGTRAKPQTRPRNEAATRRSKRTSTKTAATNIELGGYVAATFETWLLHTHRGTTGDCPNRLMHSAVDMQAFNHLACENPGGKVHGMVHG